MKKNTLMAIWLMLLAGWTLMACDTSDSVDNVELSRDCIISNIQMGSLKRTIYTKTSTGKDSMYTVTVTGSLYPLYIDHLNRLVYNADSLPINTHVEKMVFNALNASNGGISIKSLTTGNDTTITATDSTDFSVPRTLTVHSQNGKFTRNYTVDIRVHKEEGDAFNWNRVAENPLNAVAAFAESRTIAVGRSLYVFGRTADGAGRVVMTDTHHPRFDEAASMETASGLPVNIRTIQYFKGAFYALADGKAVKASAATEPWYEVAGTQIFDALAGSSSDSLYALKEGHLYASANGREWYESANDRTAALPVSAVAASLQKSHIDKDLEVLVLVGNDAEGKVSLWKKDVDLTGTYSFPWMNMPQTEELGAYACPQLQSYDLMPFDGGTVLVGMQADGKVSPLYMSADNGRTWKSNVLTIPEVDDATTISATTDDEHYIWLVCGGSGKVYRGRFNRLGWTEEQTEFYKSPRR